MVPNPVNPQSLNRYSYAVNNPLKYTDPMGNSFQLPPPDFNYNPYPEGDIPYMRIPPNWNKLFIAYIYAVHQFPEISHYGCDPLTDINWGPSGLGSAVLGGGLIPQQVRIDSLLRDASVLEVSLVLIHELAGHFAEGRFSNSVIEETRGLQAQYKTAVHWQLPPDAVTKYYYSQFAAKFRDIDLLSRQVNI